MARPKKYSKGQSAHKTSISSVEDFDVKSRTSSTVEKLWSAFSEMGPISSGTIAKEILLMRSDEASAKMASLIPEKFQGEAEKRPFDEWLKQAEGLFDPEAVSELDETMLLIGLGLLDPALREHLNQDSFWDSLITGLKEPLHNILNERGRELLILPDSVPTVPDNPLDKMDQDRLGRAAFAEFLAQRIIALSEKEGSYAIHLYGPWGAGKTTLLRFLKDLLQKENKESGSRWLVVEYNAWRNQHIHPPWWALLDAVYQETKDKLSFRKRACELWWRFSAGRGLYLVSIFILIVISWGLARGVFPWLQRSSGNTSLLAVFEDMANLIALGVTLWGIILAFTRSLLFGSPKAAQSYMNSVSNPMNKVRERFKTLIRRLTPYRVAILIDDLDRCRSDYAVALLEGIQTLFRDAPVIFVVAADRRWLNACYEEVYQSLKPWVNAPGKSLGTLFLEKTFQLSTSVPAVPSELKKEYWENLIGIDTAEIERKQKEAIQRAKEKLADIKDEARLMSILRQKNTDPLEQQALRQAVVVQLGKYEVVKRTEHALRKFVPLIEPNPRSMKRMVNAYNTYRALAILLGMDINRDQLALWTILSLRWPQLADALADAPELIEGPNQLGQSVAAEISSLLETQEVREVIQGGTICAPLDTETVRPCAHLRS